MKTTLWSMDWDDAWTPSGGNVSGGWRNWRHEEGRRKRRKRDLRRRRARRVTVALGNR